MKKLMVGLPALTWACGGETVVPNQVPVVLGPIPDQTMEIGDTVAVDLNLVFSDPDGDSLSYVARSQGRVIAKVTGSILGVVPVGVGMDTVSVTATDPDGESATASAQVTVVNSEPEVTDPIPDRRMFRSDTEVIDLNEHFEDPDGETLTYSAMSSDSTIVRTEVTGSTLRFAAVMQGTASVTVTATDAADASAMDGFEVEIPNRAPVATADIPTQSVPEDFSVTIPLTDHFGDPDDDGLLFTAVSSNGDVVTATVQDGLLLVLNGLSVGEASVEVTARDPFEASANQEFDVAVRELVVQSWEDQFIREELEEGGEWTQGGGGRGGVTAEGTWIQLHLLEGDWKARAQPLELEYQWSIATRVKIKESNSGWACAAIESRIDDDNFRKWALDLGVSSALMEVYVRDNDGEWLLLADHDYEFEYDDYYEVGWWIEGDSMHVSVDGTTELSFDPVADGEEWPGDDIPMPTKFNGVNLGMTSCGEGTEHHAGYDWVKVRGG